MDIHATYFLLRSRCVYARIVSKHFFPEEQLAMVRLTPHLRSILAVEYTMCFVQKTIVVLTSCTEITHRNTEFLYIPVLYLRLPANHLEVVLI